MKMISTLLVVLALGCSANRNSKENASNQYYFYFGEKNNIMESYYNQEKQVKSYWFDIQNADKIVFKVKKHKEVFEIKRIKPKDTVGLNVKDFSWLNQFDNLTRYKFFNTKPLKKFYLIEKDSSKNYLKLMEVEFVDEIE